MLRSVGAALSAAVLGGLVLASPAQAGSYKDEPIGVRVDWSGVYLGIHGGGGWSKSSSELTGPPGLEALADLVGIPSSSSQDLDGFLAGGHVGLQKQFGGLVLGVEASFTGGRLRGSSTTGFDGAVGLPPILGATWDGETTTSTKIGEIFTATGRIGFASERWLGYVKGGYASAKVSNSSLTGVDVQACVLGCFPVGSGGGTTSSDARHHGWVIGGGVEYMINPNVTFGIEYNYIDLGAKTHSGVTTIDVTNVGSGTFRSSTRIDAEAIHAVYARLSFKVGGDDSRGPFGW
jgi:outer membrane immunogenic protein